MVGREGGRGDIRQELLQYAEALRKESPEGPVNFVLHSLAGGDKVSPVVCLVVQPAIRFNLAFLILLVTLSGWVSEFKPLTVRLVLLGPGTSWT